MSTGADGGPVKGQTELIVTIADDELRPAPERRRVAQLLRGPHLRWSTRHRGAYTGLLLLFRLLLFAHCHWGPGLAFRPRWTKRHGMGFDVSREAKRTKEQPKAAPSKLPGTGKVQKLLGGFDSAVPILRDLGYELSDVTIKLGIPPSLVATFQFKREVSQEEVTAALRENKGHKLVSMLIRMLAKARKFQSGVRIAGFKAQSTAVEIGLLAGVSVKFA